MSSIEITFLGTGTSHGIPMIGCRCEVCTSDDPRDRRFRTAVAVQLPPEEPTAGRVIIIDMPPEFRLAALANSLPRVDAVLFTHAHADHIMGLDDIRRYNDIVGGQIDAYADPRAMAVIRQCFAHADRPFKGDGWPSLNFQPMTKPTEVCGTTVTPIPLMHGREEILGFRIGRFAYCTDCSEIPESSWPLLEGLDVLVLDSPRITPHPTHFNLEQALAAVARAKPARALLTHIAHQISHAKVSAELPDGVEIAHDGLGIHCSMLP